MAEEDLFNDIEFGLPNESGLRVLRSLTEPDDEKIDRVFPKDMTARIAEMQRLFSTMEGGCRLSAPPSKIFEVSAGAGGDLVTRCGHDPYHEWHGRKRVK